MDENKGINGHPQGCMCRMCRMGGMSGMQGWGCYGHRGPMHLIFRIVLIVVVFWIGTQVGESHAYRDMMGGYGWSRHAPMMGAGYNASYDSGYGPYGPGSATSSGQ